MHRESDLSQLGREQQLRRRAYNLGYVLRKSGRDTLDGTYMQDPRDLGMWMIIDAATNMPITGLRYELTIEDVEVFLDVRG